MRHLKSVLVAIVVSCLCFVGIGYFLTSSYHIEESILIKAPQTKVFHYTSDLHKWPAWTAWNNKKYQDLELKYSTVTPGPGLVMAWSAAGDNGKVVHTATKDKNVYFDVVFDKEMVTEGHILLIPQKHGFTKAVWVMEGDVGNNFFKRYMLLFLDKFLVQDMNTGLQNLKKICEKD